MPLEMEEMHHEYTISLCMGNIVFKTKVEIYCLGIQKLGSEID
jgi:hypothetical protein